MTIEQTNVIGIASIGPESGDVFLSISDHLEWDEEGEHLLLLHNKINAYVSFVEGGEIYERSPQYAGRKIVINVTNKYPPSEQASLFFRLTQDAMGEAGIGPRHRNPTSHQSKV